MGIGENQYRKTYNFTRWECSRPHLPPIASALGYRHWIEKKGGGILRAHQKQDFGAIQYFHVIANYKKSFLYVALK